MLTPLTVVVEVRQTAMGQANKKLGLPNPQHETTVAGSRKLTPGSHLSQRLFTSWQKSHVWCLASPTKVLMSWYTSMRPRRHSCSAGAQRQGLGAGTGGGGPGGSPPPPARTYLVGQVGKSPLHNYALV